MPRLDPRSFIPTRPLPGTCWPAAAAVAAVLLAGLAAPASAQQAADPTKVHEEQHPAQPAGFLAEFLDFHRIYGGKVIALAREIPETELDWRPRPEARSVRELLVHIGRANHGAAASAMALVGGQAPPQPDWASLESRDALAGAVQASFELTRNVAAGMASLDVSMAPEGSPQSLRATLTGFALHHSEHLGQLIAYARSVGAVPPWSR